jgi:hypothetical protein
LLTFLLLFLPLLFTLVLGFGWVEAHTTWSKDGEKKTIPELQRRLIEIINLAKKEKWKIPDNPPSKVPVRKSWTPVGTITKMAIKLGTERDDMAANLDKRARVEWRDRNTRGEGDILQNIQALGDRTIDKSFVGTMIECYVSFDIGTNPDGTKKTTCRWCRAKVKAISNGKWLCANARTKCYEKNQAAKLLWDAVEECGLPESTGIQELPPKLWNKNVEGAWRRSLTKETFGL